MFGLLHPHSIEPGSSSNGKPSLSVFDGLIDGEPAFFALYPVFEKRRSGKEVMEGGVLEYAMNSMEGVGGYRPQEFGEFFVRWNEIPEYAKHFNLVEIRDSSRVDEILDEFFRHLLG